MNVPHQRCSALSHGEIPLLGGVLCQMPHHLLISIGAFSSSALSSVVTPNSSYAFPFYATLVSMLCKHFWHHCSSPSFLPASNSLSIPPKESISNLKIQWYLDLIEMSRF